MAKFKDFRQRVVFTCSDVNEFLTAYAERELDESTRSRFERHVGRCSACATYFDQYKATIDLVKSSGSGIPEKPPEELIQLTLAFLREHLKSEN
jgi:anti-sigma factor RsiW